LRDEIRHHWKFVSGTFKLYWLRRLSASQREGLLTAAFLHTAQTPGGDGYRRFLIDLTPAQLSELNGKVFIDFIEEIITQTPDCTAAPIMGAKLLRVFDGWTQANNTNDAVADHVNVFLHHLRMRVHFARLIFSLRTAHKILSMWQNFIAPYAPETAAANPYRLEVSSLTR
jgi:hypothetical protein